MIRTLFLITTALFVFTGCFGKDKPQEWTSYVYPDKSNTKRSMNNGLYPSLEECREASKAKLTELKLDKGDYKCALNCEYHEGMKTEICEKMTK